MYEAIHIISAEYLYSVYGREDIENKSYKLKKGLTLQREPSH